MTGAAALAGAAGAAAAVGMVDAVAVARSRRRRVRGLRLMARVVRRLGAAMGARAPRGLGERLAAAGVDAPLGDVMALKAGLALVAALASLPLVPEAPGRLGPVLLLAAPAAAFLAPDAWLRRRTAARRQAMEGELADVLDLLRVAIVAGLPPRRALAEVGRRHRGALAAEFRRAAGRAALGEPADAVLSALASRCPAHGVPALVAALGRAERHGAPLAGTLAAQAAEARSLRAQRAAEAAAKAAPKIQLVVALLLVPAVMLLVAAALAPALAGR